MRNRIATVIAAVAFSGAALQAAELSLGSGAVEPGKSVTLELTLTGGNQQSASLQCDMEYDFDTFSIAVEPGPASKLAEKTIAISQPEGNILRLLVMGVNQNTLGDGVVALVTVSARTGAKGGGVHDIRVARVVGATSDAVSISFTSTDGQVRVGPRRARPVPGKQEGRGQ